MRQVAHALLTRPPLTLLKILPKLHQRVNSVRLACVRHAASVHPEPGSNSHVKISSIPARTKTLAFVLSVITFGLLLLNNSLGIFQGCITVYLSRCLFLQLSAATHLEYHSCSFLSRTFLKNFLNLFRCLISVTGSKPLIIWVTVLSATGKSYYSKAIYQMQQLFS